MSNLVINDLKLKHFLLVINLIIILVDVSYAGYLQNELISQLTVCAIIYEKLALFF